MNQKRADLFRLLCEATSASQIQQVNHEIDSLMLSQDLSDDLLEAIKEQVPLANWGCICSLIFIVQRFPSRKFTPILCDLLDNYRADVFMEAIADALFDIADDRSVPSLIRALDYEAAGDPDYHFNRKIVWALEKIGDRSAIEGLKIALSSPSDLVQEQAQKALDKLNRRTSAG